MVGIGGKGGNGKVGMVGRGGIPGNGGIGNWGILGNGNGKGGADGLPLPLPLPGIGGRRGIFGRGGESFMSPNFPPLFPCLFSFDDFSTRKREESTRLAAIISRLSSIMKILMTLLFNAIFTDLGEDNIIIHALMYIYMNK